MKLRLVIGLLICTAIPAAAQQTQVVEEVIVKINDEIITLSDFNRKFEPVEREISRRFEGEERDRELESWRKNVFNSMINRALLRQNARKYGFRLDDNTLRNFVNYLKEQSNSRTDEEFRQALADQGMTMDDVREIAENQYTEGFLFRQEVTRDLYSSESKIQEFYEEHIERYSTPSTLRLGQIIFPFEEDNRSLRKLEADQALARIKAGEDFGAVYRSVTPQSAPDADGDIGQVREEALRVEMQDAIDNLKSGEVSEVLELPTAFLIVRVTAREPQRNIPLEEIKDRVMQDMQEQAVNEGMQELILRYKKESYIDVKSADFITLYDRTSTVRGR